MTYTIKASMILPMCGAAKRFTEKGLSKYKHFYKFKNETMLYKTLKPISNLKSFHMIFVLVDLHQKKLVLKILKKIKHIDYTIYVIGNTQSPNHTLHKLAINNKNFKKYINLPTYIHTLDISHDCEINLDTNLNSNITYVFKAFSNNYSYVKTDQNNIVTSTKEKKLISNIANAGIYKLISYKLFDQLYNNENYKKYSSIFEYLFHYTKKKNHWKIFYIKSLVVYGTPSELFFCNKFYFPMRQSLELQNYIVCSDHSGCTTHKKMIKALKSKNRDYTELLPNKNYESYTNMCYKIKKNKNFNKSIIFMTCKSAQGFNIAANKLFNDFSTIIYDFKSFELAISHNCSRVFCFPDKLNFSEGFFRKIIELSTKVFFEGGRHQNKLMDLIEDKNLKL